MRIPLPFGSTSPRFRLMSGVFLGLAICGCQSSDGGNEEAKLGPLVQYESNSFGVRFLTPASVEDVGQTLPRSDTLETGRVLRNIESNPYFTIWYFESDIHEDWLGRNRYIEIDHLSNVDSSEVLIHTVAGKRYEYTREIRIDKEEHFTKWIRIALPREDALFIFEMGFDHHIWDREKNAIEEIVASIRFD